MIGKTLGHYKVLEQLGAGGMGQVFLAQDLQQSRLVALKILPKDLAYDQQRMKRFLRESKIASAIQHESVARIYEVGEIDQLRFISMEYLKGQTLEARLDSGPLTILEVIAVGIQMAEGLAAAHACGIVHRDIKPGNVMILPDGKLKILDFGLAKVHEKKNDDFSSTRTEIGTAVGTVNYMSPEQVMGVSLDYRSDIFSLGVVLYESLTGNRPFGSKNLYTTVELILRSQPPAIVTVVPDVPIALEQIILKCMQKEPKNRFQSCIEVAESLRAARGSIKQDVDSVQVGPTLSDAATIVDPNLKSKRSPWFYLEMTITVLVFIGLCLYMLQSCH